MLINKYEIVSNISNGEFGVVLKVAYNNKFYALKYGAKDLIKYEIQIYKHLRSIANISPLHDVFEHNNKLCMVLDLYAMNLVDYKVKCYNSENYYERTINIIKDLIIIIKSLHENNIIHRDLKPTNVCLNNNYKLYLIDFGISKIYRHNNIHNKETQIKSLIGSINFSSLNILNLIEPSRRDDVEALLFILFYLLINDANYVSYDKLNAHDKKNIAILVIFLQDNTNNIVNNKTINYSLIEKLFNYVRRLKYDQAPKYDYITTLLTESYVKN
jgi:serine/threonine protein kinase